MSEPLPVSPALDAACTARDRGWRPFPVDHPALRSCAGAHGNVPCNGQRGKHPTGGWAAQAAIPQSDKTLALWFGAEPRNVGIACGPSGLVVLDEDELGALTDLAARLGETLPATYRVRSARGWHYYFAAPEDQVIGNRAGALAVHHIDVRGGKGGGGYVVGAGSVHVSGHVYTAENPNAPLADLPGWIIDQIQTQPERPDAPAGTSGPMDWTDDVRLGDEDELRGQFERRLDQIQGKGNTFREQLYLAARDGWRLVDCKVLDEHSMLRALKDAVIRVWGLPPDDRDKRIVYDEARPDAQSSPWALAGGTVIGEHSEVGERQPAEAPPIPDPVTEPDEYEKRLQNEVRKQRLLRDAKAILAAENRAPLRVLDFDDFLDSPTPEYLVPGMLYRDGLATVFGPPGAAKSFLLLDIAMSLATGQPWRGRDIGRGLVHYVMAEGQAVNNLRARAWLADREVDREEARGRFVTIPEGVVLTPEGITSYLPLVLEHKPDLIVLDTKNLMFAGKESQGDDLGIMLRALHALRMAADSCAVVLVDHSGLTDDSRTRGSNAQKGGMDTEVRVVELDGGIREATVTRDKSGVVGRTWHYKLRSVDGVPVPPDMTTPAVCVPVEDALSTVTPFRRTEDWNDPDQAMLPTDVAGYNGKGRAAINAVARFMRHSAVGGLGMTMVQARKAVRSVYVDERGKAQWSEDSVDRAWGALRDLGRIDPAEGNTHGNPTGLHWWVERPNDPA